VGDVQGDGGDDFLVEEVFEMDRHGGVTDWSLAVFGFGVFGLKLGRTFGVRLIECVVLGLVCFNCMSYLHYGCGKQGQTTIVRMVFQSLVLLVVGAMMLLTSCASWQKTSAIDRLKPCLTAEGPTDGYCGTMDVWEDREAGAGRKIALKIIVLPGLKQNSAADPLFFLAGGPGQGAAALATMIRERFRSVQTDRDIVLVDQRGTGKSGALECKPDKDEEKSEDVAFAVDRLRACLASYTGKADVTKYTTTIAMDDLDQVRSYLGYSKINLYGGSYGTRAALVYSRRHAAHTRAVILDGVAPTDMRLPLYMARDGQRALELLFRDCEKDKACQARFPGLRAKFSGLIERLTAKPQKVRYVHPRTGEEKEMDAKRALVTSMIFTTLYQPTMAALVPLLIEQADKGNFSGILALGAAMDSGDGDGGIAQGMHFSVVCSEDFTRIEPGVVEKETAGTFMGKDMAEMRMKICGFWPKGKVEAEYFKETPSDLPALILSGELDPVTPPSWGEGVARQWKNSKHIVVPGTGHGTMGAGCVMKLITKFLQDGSVAQLDAGCVSKVERPPFFLGPAGPDPMRGGQ